MNNRKKILENRRKRIHGKKLTSDVVSISHFLKAEKRINHSIIDKWMSRIRSKIHLIKKDKN